MSFLDQIDLTNKPAVRVTTGGLLDTSQTVVPIHPGDGFTMPGYRTYVVAWREDIYATPSYDPKARVGLLQSRTSNTLTVEWGHFGTPTSSISGTATIAVLFDDSGDRDMQSILDEVIATRGERTTILIPNGVNDDVQIQTAINALGLAGGGTIIQRAGDFKITKKIDWLFNNITLLGEGDATRWQIADALNTDVISIGDNGTTTVLNGRVAYFQIDGNDTNQTASTYGVHMFKLVSNFVVEGMYIHHLYGKAIYNDGLLGNRNKYVRISGNRLFNMNSAGDYDCIDDQNTDHTLIEFNICIMPGDDAIDIGTADYCVINGNTVLGWTSSVTGVGTGIETDACNHLNISNNAIYHANDYAIRIENQFHTICTGNNIYASWHIGIEVHGSSYCVISDNQIRRTGQTTNNSYSAIQLNSVGSTHSTFNRITDNIIRDDGTNKAKYGIEEKDSNQNNNTISDNTIIGSVTASVLRSGANSTFKRNVGANPDGSFPQGNITGAITFDRSLSETITATLTGNITPTISAGVQPGDILRLILTQDGTGSRTVTWPSNFKKAGGTLTLSTGAAAVDVIEMTWDGTNWRETSRSLNQS